METVYDMISIQILNNVWRPGWMVDLTSEICFLEFEGPNQLLIPSIQLIKKWKSGGYVIVKKKSQTQSITAGWRWEEKVHRERERHGLQKLGLF